MSEQSQEQTTEEDQPEAPKTYAEWREPLHRLFGKDAEPTDEDKKGGISAEGPFVSDHSSESSESDAEPEADPNQSVPGQPTYQGSGETPDSV